MLVDKADHAWYCNISYIIPPTPNVVNDSLGCQKRACLGKKENLFFSLKIFCSDRPS